MFDKRQSLVSLRQLNPVTLFAGASVLIVLALWVASLII